MQQHLYNCSFQQISKLCYQILWLNYWHNLQQNHHAQTLSSVFCHLSPEPGDTFDHGFAASLLSIGFDAKYGDLLKTASSRIIVNALVAGTISEITGGKFASGAMSAAFRVAFNELLERDQKESTSSDNAGNDSETNNEHFYSVGPTALCDTSNHGCTLENALNIVNMHSVPNTLSPNEGEHTIHPFFVPWWSEKIIHRIDRKNNAIFNITKPNHSFHPGSVRHQLSISGGIIFLQTFGTGRGKWPAFNNNVGRVLFKNTHVSSQNAMRRITEPYNDQYYRWGE